MKRIFITLIAINLLFCPRVYANLSVDLDTIVVTNSRSQQQERKMVSNVTVITQEQIAASNASSIADLLRSAQGVNVYDNGTNKTAVLDIRGFGDTASRNVLVLINGRKVNSIDISGPDLEQIPLGSVARIEIIRGAGSVLYGDNAVGGVVNIITKKGEGNLKGLVGMEYASYGNLSEDAEISGSHKDLSYYFYSKYAHVGGYRDNSDELSKDFNSRLGYAFSKFLSAELEMAWHKDDTGLPAGLYSANLEQLGRRASTTPDDFTSTKDRYVKLGFNAKPVVKEENFGDFTIDLLYRNRDTFGSLHYIDFNNNLQTSDTKRSIDTYGVTGKYVFDRTLFNKEFNFVTGVDYYDNSNDIIGSGTNTDNLTITKKEFGIYDFLQYEMFDKVFISTGTRYNKADYGFHQRNIISDSSQSPDVWVSLGGVKYEFARGSNLHFGWQQTFRFLATDEWYNSFPPTPGLNLNLKQQTGVQYEAGIKHDFNDTFIVGITPYVMMNKNEIYLDPATLENKNYDKTKRGGIEFNLRVDLLKIREVAFLDKLEAMTNYTYQVARFDKGANDGNDIPMVPRHEASQALNAVFLKYYNVSLTERFVGSRYAINDIQNSTSPVKPYEVCDAKVAYKRKNYEIYGGVNNLFDRKYYTYVAKSGGSSNKSYFPSPERNFSIGMVLKF